MMFLSSVIMELAGEQAPTFMLIALIEAYDFDPLNFTLL